MTQAPDDFDGMVRKATMLANKGLIEQAAPIIFKIDDMITNSSNTLTHNKISNALLPVIRFYFTEEINERYPDKVKSFVKRFTEYIRVYRNAFEDILNIPARNDYENIFYALVNNHLGNFYELIELHDNAELNYNAGIEILKNYQEGKSELSAMLHCNLGHTYYMQGKETETRTILYKAYDIQKEMNRQYTICTANILSYLSICVDDDNVNKYVKESIKIRRHIFPPESPEHSESLIAIALMLVSRGRHARAIVYYQKALLVQQNKIPVDHKEIFNTLYLLALGSVQINKYTMAYRYFIKAQTEETLWINQKVWIFNDYDRAEFLERTYEYLQVFMTFVNVFMNKNRKAILAAYSIYLSRKGLLLETQKRFQQSVINNASPAVQNIIFKLNNIRSQLASAYHISNLKIQQASENYIELEEKRKALEEELRRAYEPYDLEKIILPTRVDEIVNYLPNDSVLISDVRLSNCIGGLL